MDYSVVQEAELNPSANAGEHLFILKNLSAAGIKNIQRTGQNLIEWPNRIEAANRNGFYLESMSLLLQLLDLWLRIFIAAKTNTAAPAKAQFGTLILEATKHGLYSNLCDSLKAFNRERIKAIHHYLLGGAEYADFAHICVAARNLENTLPMSVIAQVGEPYSGFPRSDDFIIIQWLSPVPPGNAQWSTNVEKRLELSRQGKISFS